MPPDPRPTIRVLPLGAGQEVGRSCVLVGMGGATLMFDCGLHMGFADARRCVDGDCSFLFGGGREREGIDGVAACTTAWP